MSVVKMSAGLDRQGTDDLVVRLQGRLDIATQGDLSAALEQTLTAGAGRVVVDFAAVTGLSGAALLPLALAQARARRIGMHLAVASVPAAAQAVFRTVWPGKEMPQYAGVADALARGEAVGASSTALSSSSETGGWALELPPVNLTGFAPQVPRINVQGQTACGPTRGFGRLWHKVYRAPLPSLSVAPEEVVAEWRAHFGEFWPAGNRMHLGPDDIAPGAPGVITLTVPPGMQLITGIQVAYSGPDCFVFLPLRGHMFCGLIIFGALEKDGTVQAQVQVLVRASDPLWETAMSLGGYTQEDQSWFHTLSQLVRHLGTTTRPQLCSSVVDDRRNWEESGGVLSNSGVWSGLYQAVGLFRGRESGS